MPRILLIEDDQKLRKVLTSDLKLEGHQVATAVNGTEGLEKAIKLKPDLVILDVMLPGMSGYDVCRMMRKKGFENPVLMLTARGEETDKVVGLDLGADDYAVKPLGSMELHARVRALLRRSKKTNAIDHKVIFDDIEINFKTKKAFRKKTLIHLTPIEYKIMELFLAREGEVLSRDTFLDLVWGVDADLTTRAVDNQILNLRQKLGCKSGRSHSYIQTVHGSGYRFDRGK